jgi:hypothetical protein
LNIKKEKIGRYEKHCLPAHKQDSDDDARSSKRQKIEKSKKGKNVIHVNEEVEEANIAQMDEIKARVCTIFDVVL